MSLRTASQFRSSVQSFNMTPIIDIVFLLIIFFLVVCQFIEAENFPVAVPDDCKFAQSDAERRAQVTTVTVMKTAKGKVGFAVGSEKIPASGYTEGLQTQKNAFWSPGIVEKLAELIDVRLRDLPPDRRVVTLRIDKDVCFSDAQYALAAVAVSGAADIRLAALKDKQPSSQ